MSSWWSIIWTTELSPYDLAKVPQLTKDNILAYFIYNNLGPVLPQRSDAVATLSTNGSVAFKENCAPIG